MLIRMTFEYTDFTLSILKRALSTLMIRAFLRVHLFVVCFQSRYAFLIVFCCPEWFFLSYSTVTPNSFDYINIVGGIFLTLQTLCCFFFQTSWPYECGLCSLMCQNTQGCQSGSYRSLVVQSQMEEKWRIRRQ